MPFSANGQVPNLPIGGFGSRDLPKLKVKKQRKKFRARKQKSNKKDRMILTLPHTRQLLDTVINVGGVIDEMTK